MESSLQDPVLRGGDHRPMDALMAVGASCQAFSCCSLSPGVQPLAAWLESALPSDDFYFSSSWSAVA